MVILPLAATLASPVLLLAATALARHLGFRIPYRVLLPVSILAGVLVAAALGLIGREPALRATVVLVLAAGVGAVHFLDNPNGRWATTLRSRLLLGVPWGTLISIALVATVYLVLQGGLEHPYSPLSIPFTSWSYLYPLGHLTAPFAHASFGHISGNLIGTIALAPLAEYAWSHFPTRRGRSSFGSLGTNPYVRAFLLFPLGVVIIALGTSIFSWGAVIGFSGVVFAFAGFAAVRYPLVTVIALSARGAINTVFYAVRDPVVVGSASPSFGPPWWVGIAVQGHLLGLLLGAILGVIVIGRRKRLPSAARLFGGIVLLGFSLALYALWWYRDPSTFVLYRGLGVVMVVVLALVLTTAVRADSRELFEGVTRRQVAVALAVLPLLTMALVAVPLNATTIDHVDPPADAIEIRDYHVYYAEDVSNERVSAVDIELLNETTAVNASGVIVVSESRHVWTEAESAGALAFWGDLPIRVGGVGWEATVTAKRNGWRVAGAGPVYNVYLQPPDGEYVHVYASENQTADPRIEYRNVTVEARNETFHVAVTRNETRLGSAPIPPANNSTMVGGLNLTRLEDRVFATRNGTRVLIATKETYE